jgi:hypothetical protein
MRLVRVSQAYLYLGVALSFIEKHPHRVLHVSVALRILVGAFRLDHGPYRPIFFNRGTGLGIQVRGVNRRAGRDRAASRLSRRRAEQDQSLAGARHDQGLSINRHAVEQIEAGLAHHKLRRAGVDGDCCPIVVCERRAAEVPLSCRQADACVLPTTSEINLRVNQYPFCVPGGPAPQNAKLADGSALQTELGFALDSCGIRQRYAHSDRVLLPGDPVGGCSGI